MLNEWYEKLQELNPDRNEAFGLIIGMFEWIEGFNPGTPDRLIEGVREVRAEGSNNAE